MGEKVCLLSAVKAPFLAFTRWRRKGKPNPATESLAENLCPVVQRRAFVVAEVQDESSEPKRSRVREVLTTI